MALPVSERIERRLCANLAAALSLTFDPTGADTAATLQRVEADGNNPPVPAGGDRPAVWVVVHFGDADVLDGEDGASTCGALAYVTPVIVEAHLFGEAPPEDPGSPVDEATNPRLSTKGWANRVNADVVAVLEADRGNLYEDGVGSAPGPSNPALVQETEVRGTFGPTVAKQQRDVECGVECDLHWRHLRGDPEAVG